VGQRSRPNAATITLPPDGAGRTSPGYCHGGYPLRDVGYAYAQQLAAAGNDLTYMHNADLTHGFIQFTRWSHACHTPTIELAELIKKRIG
jgi:acetyl esterase/lipase